MPVPEYNTSAVMDLLASQKDNTMADIRVTPSGRGHRLAWNLIASIAVISLLGACAKSEKGHRFSARSIAPRYTGSTAVTQNRDMELHRALAYWGKAFSKNPQHAQTAVNYAKNLKAAKDYQQAFKVLDHANRANPNNRMVASEYGRLALKLGKTELAEKVLRRVDGLDGKDWRVVSARGTIYAQKGNHKKARSYFKRALVLAPNEPSILNNLALTYALDGKAAKAETLLRQAVKNESAKNQVKQNLALVLGLQGRFNEAKQIAKTELPTKLANNNVTYLRKMIRKTPDNHMIAEADEKPVSPPATLARGRTDKTKATKTQSSQVASSIRPSRSLFKLKNSSEPKKLTMDNQPPISLTPPQFPAERNAEVSSWTTKTTVTQAIDDKKWGD